MLDLVCFSFDTPPGPIQHDFSSGGNGSGTARKKQLEWKKTVVVVVLVVFVMVIVIVVRFAYYAFKDIISGGRGFQQKQQ